MDKKCPNCGGKVDPEAKYCAKCGQKLDTKTVLCQKEQESEKKV